jgi:2',3'-cyclic-nucleotide 2'-phosphodiesterase (5'-nucleotidase family)
LYTADESIEQLISPFRDSIQIEMGVYIATSPLDLIVGRPSSSLGNWVADAIFVDQTKSIRLKQPVMCLLNTGGIRSTINKGEITLGDMYRLMPFDNEIVWIELPASSLLEIESYLKKTTGEPIANAYVRKGKLAINGWRDTTSRFWVITSDYLANGGDKMTFFSKRLTFNRTGRLMRDALIESAKEQGLLSADSSNRIDW